MIEAALASEVVKWLAPSLPYVLTASSEAAKGFGKKIGEEAFKKAQDLYHLLSPTIEKKPAVKEAVTEVVNAPEDKAASGAFEMQLRKIFAEDPELASKVQALIAKNTSSGKAIIAYGERSVAGENFSGAVVITGDKNTSS